MMVSGYYFRHAGSNLLILSLLTHHDAGNIFQFFFCLISSLNFSCNPGHSGFKYLKLDLAPRSWPEAAQQLPKIVALK
jgi:hypothetical protein